MTRYEWLQKYDLEILVDEITCVDYEGSLRDFTAQLWDKNGNIIRYTEGDRVNYCVEEFADSETGAIQKLWDFIDDKPFLINLASDHPINRHIEVPKLEDETEMVPELKNELKKSSEEPTAIQGGFNPGSDEREELSFLKEFQRIMKIVDFATYQKINQIIKEKK